MVIKAPYSKRPFKITRKYLCSNPTIRSRNTDTRLNNLEKNINQFTNNQQMNERISNSTVIWRAVCQKPISKIQKLSLQLTNQLHKDVDDLIMETSAQNGPSLSKINLAKNLCLRTLSNLRCNYLFVKVVSCWFLE